MQKLLQIYDHIPGFLKTRYAITLMIFLIWMLFFDENNFLLQYKRYQTLDEARQKKAYFIEQIGKNREMQELLTNEAYLEKFAREQYYMKKDDEELYIIVRK